MENDITKVVEEMSIQVMESEEEFIFKTIRPYCENVLQREINKKELEQILVRGASSEHPRGMWIYKDHVWKCLCCGGNPHKGTGFVPSKETMKTQWKFCNLCGAEMKVMEEEGNES